jgi:hypothetical protein
MQSIDYLALMKKNEMTNHTDYWKRSKHTKYGAEAESVRFEEKNKSHKLTKSITQILDGCHIKNLIKTNSIIFSQQ